LTRVRTDAPLQVRVRCDDKTIARLCCAHLLNLGVERFAAAPLAFHFDPQSYGAPRSQQIRPGTIPTFRVPTQHREASASGIGLEAQDGGCIRRKDLM
jgi:hypothetical protein